MNIKKLTLIATAVSALSLSPLTYARTESNDMSIIGIEPECSYFADLRFNASPFGSKGSIAADKDSKFEFDKFSWGGSAGIGTEITPGFEVSLVASVMTNIGTDSASSTTASSSPSSSSSSSATTPASSTNSRIKLEDKHRDAYNKWLNRSPDAFNLLNKNLDQNELYKILASASKGYSMKSIKILPVGNGRFDPGNPGKNAREIVALNNRLLKSEYPNRLYSTLPGDTQPDQQDFCKKLSLFLTELNNNFGNDNPRNAIAHAIDIKQGNNFLTDAQKQARANGIANALGNVNVAGNEALNTYKYDAGDQAFRDTIEGAVTTIQNIANAIASDANVEKVDIKIYGTNAGSIYHNCAPEDFNQGPAAGADAAAIATFYNDHPYAIRALNNLVNPEAVRGLFSHHKFFSTISALSNMMALADQPVRAQLNKKIADILTSQKGTPQYKELVEGFKKQLEEAGIKDRSAEEIIDAIIAENNAEADAKAKADEKAKDNKTSDTDTKTTKKPVDVNLTKLRVGLEGGFRLLEFGSGSLSVIAGVGATAVTGTIADEDTGYMWGAEVYGGVKGEYAISESMAITARYTYTPALFSGSKLNDKVQAKVKSLGYTDDAIMSSLSMHELSAGIRFYF